MMSASDFDTLEALSDQRKLLEMKRVRLDNLINTIDKTLNNLTGGEIMSNNDLFTSFNDDQLEQYKTEAKNRWGHTNEYKQSIERTKNWTKEDYKAAKEGGKAFTQELANVMDKGSEGPEAQAMIGQLYKSIGTFYDCSLVLYRNLGEGYVSDPRFTAYFDVVKPGLAQFTRDAIVYFVEQHKK
jgi:hypothetical protein